MPQPERLAVPGDYRAVRLPMALRRPAATADPSRMNPNHARGEPARKAHPGPRAFRGSGWACLGACLLAVTAGCQAPPARPAACDPDGPVPPRKAVLARQLLADTAVAVAHHPARAGYTLLTEPVAYLRAAAVGTFYKRLVLPLAPEPPPLDPARPTLDPAALEEELQKVAGNELRPADVRLFVDGPEALAALHRVIDGAACRIDVLMYLWDSDPLGEEVAAHLASRAGPGCRVRVLVDGGGNLIDGLPKGASAAEVNRVVCRLARQPYVEVIRTRNAAARFDHRKLVVADGRLAWSGGRNFTAPSFFEYHDLSYTLAGPLAGEMAEVFEDFWREQGGTPAPPTPESPAPVANAWARLVRTRPVRRQLAQVLYRAVDRARHHVYMENPYFSDPRVIARLARARQRGADVRVVLTVHSDSPAVDRSNKVTANRLLRAGVRVYLYPGMTHVKATAVDGRWAYLGTGNFDALSLRHNRELGLAVGEGPLIAELERRLFLPDFRPEWELTEPLPLSAAEYLYEALASLFL
jgi:cardiolipin synthase